MGAVVRLVLWLCWEGLTLKVYDEKDYNVIAVHLVEDGVYANDLGEPTSIRPPVLPVLIAGIYAFCGLENYQAVRLFQAGLSLVTVVLVYQLGMAVYSRKVGLWAAALTCFYPSLLGANNMLLTEVVFAFFLTGACLMLVRAMQNGALWQCAAAGLLFGLAALSRGVLWLFPVVAVPFLLWVMKGRLSVRLSGALALLAVFALTLTPWAIRNFQLERTFIAVDTQGGRCFMFGNYQYTPLTRMWDLAAVPKEESWYAVLAQKYPNYNSLTQGQKDKLALREGLQFALDNPSLTLQRDVIKFFNFWQLERELVAGAGQGNFGQMPKVVLLLLTAIIFGSYALVLLAGVFGMVLVAPGERRGYWLMLLVIAYLCIMHTLAFGHSRYHLPIMPLVLTFAAAALVNSRSIWARRKTWSFWAAVAICAVFAGSWLWEIWFVDFERFRSALLS
jgi:4-amino-4-deoxy-L-arabinose transferase-like glycosyltransferase